MARLIGTLAEKSLHAALKAHYAQAGDALECDLDGYVIDILRSAEGGSRQCIEIQTRHLGSMKPKLKALLDRYPIRVIHPIAQERTITRVDADGIVQSRRKSPRRGTVYHVFPELVSLPSLIGHAHFSLEVALIREEQVWLDDGQGSWRRKHWSIADRRLIEVVRAIPLATPEDFAALVPDNLPATFDSGELASAIRQPRALAGKMAYCLREMGILEVVDKHGRAFVYRVNS